MCVWVYIHHCVKEIIWKQRRYSDTTYLKRCFGSSERKTFVFAMSRLDNLKTMMLNGAFWHYLKQYITWSCKWLQNQWIEEGLNKTYTYCVILTILSGTPISLTFWNSSSELWLWYESTSNATRYFCSERRIFSYNCKK